MEEEDNILYKFLKNCIVVNVLCDVTLKKVLSLKL